MQWVRAQQLGQTLELARPAPKRQRLSAAAAAQGGRWAVECEDTEENVRVRTANLTALGEGGEGGEGGDGPRGSTALLGGYAEEFVWVQVDDPQPSA